MRDLDYFLYCTLRSAKEFCFETTGERPFLYCDLRQQVPNTDFLAKMVISATGINEMLISMSTRKFSMQEIKS